MQTNADERNPGLAEGLEIEGYQIKRIVELKTIRSFFYELEHLATGAQHVHISNKDKENTFAVAFKTVPADSTGVAHILEHTVLCGSDKFPVRDPFFAMLKRSLSTFMNAFTASDWTMYPFSTQNRKDYYNLMDVYLDAVFFPQLHALSFKQEGHRLEFDNASNDSGHLSLVYKGVVYNEMKGAMSSPDQVMVRSLLNALYPDTTYRYNSGGDPAFIPTLTHEQLKQFHARHYHPSNAFFYTYGDIALQDHLAFIESKILDQYDRIDPGTTVPNQPRWDAPQTVTYTYPLSKDQDPAKKCQACLAWLVADIKDTFEVLVLVLLEQILLGNSASPLRKALIDSGLGSALSDGSGFDADNRDTLFACGLKDVVKDSLEQIETIVFDTLNQLVTDGIDSRLIEAAIHQIEFHRKEITNTPYPFGIKLLVSFAGSWFHGGDPVKIFQFDEDIRRIQTEAAAGPFFERYIRKYLLDNPHRVRFTLMPDQEMETRKQAQLEQSLATIQAQLSADETERIKQDAAALQKLQDSKEDLSVLPTLSLSEIPPSVTKIQPSSTDRIANTTIYEQPVFDIVYFSAAIGTGLLNAQQIDLVPFFCHVATKIGTRRHDYVETARRIDAYTGGIGLAASAHTRFDGDGRCLSFVNFNGKALQRNQDKMFEILTELMTEYDFSDLTRLKTLLLEYRAGLESMIVHNGHRLAISLSARNFSSASLLNEHWHGVHQIKFIKALTAKLDEKSLQRLSDDLKILARRLFASANMQMALFGEKEALSAAQIPFASLRERLAAGDQDGFQAPPLSPETLMPREGWQTSTAVSFVAQTFETVPMAHSDSPALAIIGKMLRSLYLHREIREKGGAYGGFAIYNPENGLFCLASYRDPHIVSSLNVFNTVGHFIRSGEYGDEDINEAILQICSEIDKPDPPGPAARKAYFRRIIGLSDEAREQFKQRLLKMTRKDILETAEKYFDQPERPHAVAVISGSTQLEDANTKLGLNPLKLKQI